MTTQGMPSTIHQPILRGARVAAVTALFGLAAASPQALADTSCHRSFGNGFRVSASEAPDIWVGTGLPTEEVDPHDDDGGYSIEISAWHAVASTVFDVRIDGELFVYEVANDGSVLSTDDALAFIGDQQLPVEPLIKTLDVLSSMACRPQFIAPDIFDAFINELSP